MLSAVSYFTPWVDKGTLRDLQRIETWQKAAIVAFTALESIAIIYLASYAGLAAFCVALPIADLCAIATFRALVALVASRISPKSDELPPPPVVQKNGSEIRKEQCRALIESRLISSTQLGTAVDNGDCFYHSIAQLLGGGATVASLRNDINEALRLPRWAAHLREKVTTHPIGIGTFEQYRQDVAKTADQMGNQGPVWGDAKREGIILCEKYGFNLLILKAGFIDSAIEGDREIQRLQRDKDQYARAYPNSSLLKGYEEDIQTRCRAHYSNPNNYYTEDEFVPKDRSYSRTLIIALFDNHFIPVVPR